MCSKFGFEAKTVSFFLQIFGSPIIIHLSAHVLVTLIIEKYVSCENDSIEWSAILQNRQLNYRIAVHSVDTPTIL